ncbi:MAG: queuosine precursor transporter [Chloroflexi bacterium]|nr:queuosine precursor transporter [Chloroflexota bacterium]MYC55015.1 queuosine precursor transporter [Chloroflexota bacterium]
MSIRNLHILILVSVAYVAAQMIADISNLRELILFGIAIDSFSIVYPLTFTLRDMAHKLAGPRIARTLIIAAAFIYLVVQAFFALIASLPPEMSEAERITLGALLTPEWRFLLAAVLASVISQLVDTEIYTRWLQRFGREKQWGRVLASNIISIPLDRVLFLVLALGGVISMDRFLELFIGVTIVRLFFGIIAIPGIYLVEEHSQDWIHITEIRHTDPPSFARAKRDGS